MARHSAVAYILRVRQTGRAKTTNFVPFGNLDGNGTRLIDLLDQGLKSLVDVRGGSTSRLDYMDHVVVGGKQKVPELEVRFHLGQIGAASRGYDQKLKPKYERIDTDLDAMTAGGLFHLPSGATAGFVVLHRPFNRGSKGMLVEFVQRQLTSLALKVEVDACTNAALFEKALRQEDGVKDVAVVRYGRPSDRFGVAPPWRTGWL